MVNRNGLFKAQHRADFAQPRTWVSLGSPVSLLLTVSATIFVVELSVMLALLPWLSDLPAPAGALLDALLLVVAVFPTLLFTLFRPLTRQSEERLHLIRDLSKAQNLLESAVAERTRQLSTLYDVSAMSSQSMDLATILDRCLERTLALMDSQIAAVQLLNEETGRLRTEASRGVPLCAVGGLGSVAKEAGLAGVVMARAEPTMVNDICAGVGASEESRGPGRLTYLGVPIETRGRMLGVLSLLRDRDRPFDNEEQALLSAIGHQLGVVVENARLVVAVQGKAILEERQRLARDLHDSVVQMLYSLTLMAEAGRRLADAGELAGARNQLERLAEISEQALKETRLLVYEMRPSSLEQTGLIGALRQRLDTVEKRAGVEVRMLVEGDLALSPEVEEGLFRISQEALNNALKHSEAKEVTLRVLPGDVLIELEVSDNGKGFDVGQLVDRGGLGLLSMRQRAEALGGTVSIVSAPGAGTTVGVALPLARAARGECKKESRGSEPKDGENG